MRSNIQHQLANWHQSEVFTSGLGSAMLYCAVAALRSDITPEPKQGSNTTAGLAFSTKGTMK